MAYEHSIFARSFSRHELKKLGFGALFIIFIMAFTLCTVLMVPILNLERTMASRLKMLMCSGKTGDSTQAYMVERVDGSRSKYINVNKDVARVQFTNSSKKDEILKADFQAEAVKTIYNFSNSRSDAYEINGDIRIHNNLSTIFVTSSNFLVENISSWTIKPYARKLDRVRIEPVRQWKIKSKSTIKQFPNCHRRFSVPAILFSTGALAVNYFHSFSDVLIPLYLTSQRFNGTVIFLTEDNLSWWIPKFITIMEKLTKYNIVDIDKTNEVLCFSRMIIGLNSNKEFGSDPLIFPHYSIRDFIQFLRSTYSLERQFIDGCHRNCSNKRPRMLIISRKRRRRLYNEHELANMARELGFDVVVNDTISSLPLVAKFVNTFDVMVGVHGAGLTNMLFLPEKSIVIQIIPHALDFASEVLFDVPSRDMNLRYLGYKVSLNESSLSKKYAPDSEEIRDPHAVQMRGGMHFHTIYLTQQDVNLDLDRFKPTLLNAMKLFRS